MAKTRRRKKRTHVPTDEDPSKKGQPKSFVFRRGRHAAVLKQLEGDLRRLMSPNTATALRETRRNALKDFVHVAGPLGVTHFLILTATQRASYLRICKASRGPTLTMRVQEHSLMRDVLSSQQRPRVPKEMWMGPPLVVLNNFSGAEHLKLAASMLQNLFPSINVQTTKLSSCQRVLLLDHNRSTGIISLRHYSISVAPSGVSRNLKTLLAHRVPDMGHLQDVAEFLTRSGYGSESEGEEAEAGRVTLQQDLGRGNATANQSRVRLYEVGPRLELEIIKVEEGLCSGRVLFHKYQERTVEETDAQQAAVEQKELDRSTRRQQQEANVRAKQERTATKQGARPSGDGHDVEPGTSDEEVIDWDAEDDLSDSDEDITAPPGSRDLKRPTVAGGRKRQRETNVQERGKSNQKKRSSGVPLSGKIKQRRT